MSSPGASRKSPLDYLFNLFTEVRPGESLGALVMGINIFLLLASYYLLKTAREALILVEGGAEVKSYASAGQALLLLAVVPAFGWLAARMGRIKLITVVNLVFASNLVFFWFLGQQGVRLGIGFYLWLGVYNNFIVAQFWSFANDIYTEEQGKRLFPAIGIGMSLGAWLGAQTAEELFAPLGAYNMMLAGALILVVSIGLVLWVNKLAVSRSAEQSRIADKPLGSEGALSLILRSRYLILIAVLIFLLNIVNTSGEFLLGKLVIAEAKKVAADETAQKNFIGTFYGGFYSWVNLIGFLMQTFLTSRLIKWIGVGGALFVLPLVSLSGYGFMLFLPLLSVVRVAKIAENGTDYSLQNTLRQALYLPVSREAKYKAKAAIDTFVVRMGDVCQAGIVFAGTSLAFTFQGFARLVVVFALLWLVVAWLLARQYKVESTAQREAAHSAP